jgi:ammonia channel protein AmtB
VTRRSVINVLFKNTTDLLIAAVAYYILGYGFAYGTDNGNGFIGTTLFGLSEATPQDFVSFSETSFGSKKKNKKKKEKKHPEVSLPG